MSFKTHLIIISAIIIAVFLSWQAMHAPLEQTNVVEPESDNNKYRIIIAHATWGRNCNDRYNMPTEIKDDNVKDVVSRLCNSLSECKINVSSTLFVEDPFPECPDKMLEIEYRCFVYDRLRNAKSSFGSLMLKCKEPSQKEAAIQ